MTNQCLFPQRQALGTDYFGFRHLKAIDNDSGIAQHRNTFYLRSRRWDFGWSRGSGSHISCHFPSDGFRAPGSRGIEYALLSRCECLLRISRQLCACSSSGTASRRHPSEH